MLKISSITFVLTDRCNLQCCMCDIWQKTGRQRNELSVSTIKGVLTSPFLKRIRHVAITGGEPFMREDIDEIVDLIFLLFPKINITIASNGTMAEEMVRLFNAQQEHMHRIFLKVSIDGLEGTHDIIRGIQGSFERTTGTIKRLREIFPSLDIEIKFVITPWNYYDIEKVTHYCQQRSQKLFIKLIENIKAYTNSLYYEDHVENNTFRLSTEQVTVIRKQLMKIKDLTNLNGNYIGHVLHFIDGGTINFPCYIPWTSLFINSDGSVFTCRYSKSLGNINHCDINEILKFWDRKEDIVTRAKDTCKKCLFINRFD